MHDRRGRPQPCGAVLSGFPARRKRLEPGLLELSKNMLAGGSGDVSRNGASPTAPDTVLDPCVLQHTVRQRHVEGSFATLPPWRHQSHGSRELVLRVWHGGAEPNGGEGLKRPAPVAAGTGPACCLRLVWTVRPPAQASTRKSLGSPSGGGRIGSRCMLGAERLVLILQQSTASDGHSARNARQVLPWMVVSNSLSQSAHWRHRGHGRHSARLRRGERA